METKQRLDLLLVSIQFSYYLDLNLETPKQYFLLIIIAFFPHVKEGIPNRGTGNLSSTGT